MHHGHIEVTLKDTLEDIQESVLERHRSEHPGGHPWEICKIFRQKFLVVSYKVSFRGVL
jgi:hypothetical protein